MYKKELIKKLLRIPKILLLDIVIFLVSLFADGFFTNQNPSENVGHGSPMFSLFAMMIMFIVTAIVVVVTAYQCVMLLFGPKEKDGTPKKKINPLIPIGFDTLLSVFLLFSVGSYEINSFYNNPEHIGFAIPIATFTLAIILFVIWVVVVLVSIYSYKKKR